MISRDISASFSVPTGSPQGPAGAARQMEDAGSAFDCTDLAEISSTGPAVPKDACAGGRTKRMMIDGMLDGAFSDRDREKVYGRLERFPENTLKLIGDYGVTISSKPLPVLSGDSGMYFPGSRKVMLAPGSNMDFFIEHPRLSAFLDSSKPLALMTGFGLALGTAFIFTALPAAVLVAGAAGLAAAPVSYFVSNFLRERSVKDPLVHETAHALDSALGALPDFKDRPVDSRVTFPYKTDSIPFSMKSPEVIDCYLACKSGREGSKFVTSYAAKDPVEYFAEGVRAYLNTERRGENAGRADLEQKDPGMFRLLDRLFGSISKGEII